MTTVERHTRLGAIKGQERLGVERFLGIRYAEPPERFRPPVASGPWEGVHDGTEFASQAMQVHFDDPVFGPFPPGGVSEDCLFLNVYTPSVAATAARPVLVWIHGGSFAGGSANLYDGTGLARSADAVVVIINYRLGLFGQADVRELGDDYRTSCNVWFLDQLAALQWVHENIADYGGDPGCVTVMGQSAGATSAVALVANPAAQGLMHRAIAFSPALLFTEDPQHVARIAEMTDTPVGDVPALLLELPADDLLMLSMQMSPHPWVDGDVFATAPHNAIRALGPSALPLISGMAPHEGEFLNAMNVPLDLHEQFTMLAGTMVPGSAAALPAYVERLTALEHPQDTLALLDAIWTDIFRRSSTWAAESTSAAGAGAWHYLIDVPLVMAGKQLRSTHCADIPLTFNVFVDAENPSGRDWLDVADPALVDLAARWVQMIATFARTGTPGDSLGAWPSYDTQSRSTLHVAAQGRSVLDDIAAEHRLKVWADDTA